MENREIYSSTGAGFSTLESLEGAVKYNNWIAGLIAPFLGETNLELGAGTGTISNLILNDHPVYLMEPEEDTRETLTQRFSKNENLKGLLSSLDEAADVEALDCIYSSNVLEHIQDDLGVIEQSFQLLRPGGFFVAMVPGGGGLLFSRFDKLLGHVRRYTRADRKRITGHLKTRGIGHRIIAYRYFNPISAAGWFLRMKLGGSVSISENDVQNAERLMELQQFLNRFSLPFGQNIFMALQKSDPSV